MLSSGGADPYLDQQMIGWIVNTARNKLWRVPSWYLLDDLIGDGLFCFTKCRARYIDGNVVKANWVFPMKPGKADKKRFMRLVQTTFLRHISSLAVRGTSEQLYDDIDDSLWPTDALITDEEATLAVTLQQLPAEIQQLLLLLARDGAGFLKFTRRPRLRETTYQQLNRLMCTQDIDWRKRAYEELT